MKDLLDVVNRSDRRLNLFEGGTTSSRSRSAIQPPTMASIASTFAHPIQVSLESGIVAASGPPVSSSTRRTILGAAAESATQRLSRVR